MQKGGETKVTRSKKFVLVTLLATVALVGSISGVVAAQNGGDSQPNAANQTANQTLLDRVCEIYQGNTGVAIDPQALEDAFAQAQSEKLQKALDSRLQYLVDQGKITQGEADQYKAWWQSRPDVPLGLGFGGHGGLRGWDGLCAPPPAE
jgi:hypothetical protein